MSKKLNGLILDDDENWRSLLKDLLSDVGANLLTAQDFDSALKLINENSFSFAILDLALSSTDHNNTQGLEILKMLSDSQPDCACFMLTGFSTVDIAVKAIVQFRARNFYRKESLDTQALIKDIKYCLAEKNQPSTLRNIGRKRSDNEDESENSRNEQETVLILEDDSDWATFHSDWLRELGYIPEIAVDIQSAIQLLKLNKYFFTVLNLRSGTGSLIDSNRPDRSSNKLFTVLREIDLPVILINENNHFFDVGELSTELNIYGYFDKTELNLENLNFTVKKIEEEHRIGYPGTLTQRELDVMRLLAEGLTNKLIAQKLFVTPNTIKRHLKSIFRKLKVNTRSGAVAKFLENAESH